MTSSFRRPRPSPALDALVGQLRRLAPGATLDWAAGAGPRTYSLCLVPVPSAGRPRLLVPPGRAGARAVLARASAADTTAAAAARLGTSLWLRAGGSALVRRRLELSAQVVPDVLQALATAAGLEVAEVRLSVAVGASRANAKPVLAVHDRHGTVVLWAKLATNPLTSSLVRREHEVLTSMVGRPPTTLTVPVPKELLRTAAGDALLMAPLAPGGVLGRRRRGVPLEALAEVATREGTTSQDARAWFEGRDAAAADTELAARWRGRHSTRLVLGGWHGDWGPWNMSWVSGRPQVWDWERHETGVPVGVDAVHYCSHAVLRERDVRRSRDHLQQVATGVVQEVLRAAGAPADRATADAVVDSYLLLVHDRFLREGGDEPTGSVLALADHYREVLRTRLGAAGEPSRALGAPRPSVDLGRRS